MAPRLLWVRLEETDYVVLENLSRSGRKDVFNKLTSDAGKAVIEAARKRMSELLAPGHSFNVGASGAASENFYTEQTKSGAGLVEWAVMEHGKPKENYFIRKGFRGTKSGRHIPRDNIRRWVADKGVML